ncbi:TonB-dependent receptor [Asticcacaulis sp. AC466]|uniref:TonB-dependent receptor n=1 Tax=Asticcacaulis sp. AC466 TaxID=1282362 RepID=UPI0003F6534B|nr:TonB-dependent receptor [Asticcacaulis sp. AC466]
MKTYSKSRQGITYATRWRLINSISILSIITLFSAPLVAAADDADPTEVVVTGQRPSDVALTTGKDKTGDTGKLLSGVAGVAVQTAGGASSRPVIHGLDDERVRITVDGMDLTSACANHMNPVLGYVPATFVDTIGVQAGITPVSNGGDSLGGTISIRTAAPLFAKSGEVLTTGQITAGYRSNAEAAYGSATATVASDTLSLRLNVAAEDASDYKDGNGDTVTSTFYKTRDISALGAWRHGNHLFSLSIGARSIPGQGFTNQQMDMIKNTSTFGNLTYEGTYDWGKLDAQVYGQAVHHLMNIGKDKLTLPGTMMMPDMPMNTRGIDTGASLRAEIPTDVGTARFGAEYRHFGLDDWWPPVAGTMMMAPETFLNINGGRRDRTSLYAELEKTDAGKWGYLAGIRTDQVVTDTHDVVGYNMMYDHAAMTFNAVEHKRTDTNWDATLIGRYSPTETTTFELGLARKSRAPNLYERYAWGTDWMSSLMINWAGDGNAYTGNQNLKPEVAHTLSASVLWHQGKDGWTVKLAPYLTQVDDFIDVRLLQSLSSGDAVLNQLQFVNETARLYGVDLHAEGPLWTSARFGNGRLHVSSSYVHGENTRDNTPLYHMMPFNAQIELEQTAGNWTNGLELEAISDKTRVDPQRREPETKAYALINIRSAYQFKTTRISLSVNNLFDTSYALPLGGVSVDNYLASNGTAAFAPVRGMGRSINLSIARSF